MSKPVTSTSTWDSSGRLRGLVGPAQRRERPQRRREPGVEHVLVARQRHRARRNARRRRHASASLAATKTVPSGPYQAGIWWPHQSWREMHQGWMFSSQSKKVFSQFFGTKRVRPSRTARERGLGQRLGIDVPLVGEPGLDHHVGAVAVRHRMACGSTSSSRPASSIRSTMRLRASRATGRAGAARSPRRLAASSDREERLVALQQQPRLGIEDVDERQLVPAPDLEIVEVVRRRDLHRARALLGIGIAVGDDRDEPSDERQADAPAVQVDVALVLRVHGDGGVAQHRLGPRGRDGDRLAGRGARGVNQGIAEVPEVALHLDRHDFDVRDRGQQLGVPVHEPLVAVDQPLLCKATNTLSTARDRPSSMVKRSRDQSQDAPRRAAGRRWRRPTRLSTPRRARGTSAGRAPGDRVAAFGELALDHHLRGDAGVVGARLPQHVAARASARSGRGCPAACC